jgi:tetratricopeptide (TPR) repeat protein
MAQAQAAIAGNFRAGVGAHEQALAKFEALAEAMENSKTRRKSNITLKRALKSWRRGDIAKAAQQALRATEEDETNPKAFHILAMALERMGHRHKALVTYERAFQLDPNDSDLLLNLGLAASARKFKDGAVKMFNLFIAACPNSPLGYNNLACLQADMGDVGGAIETLRGAIYRLPGNPMLWSTLGTMLAEDGRGDESLVFYQEALRLDPKVPRSWHNLGYAYTHLGRNAEALEAFERALRGFTDPAEIMEAQYSRGIALLALGRIEEGFREYEIRNNPMFRGYTHHMVTAPAWKGEPLDGKRLLIVGEQGLGDEFMFANIVPDLLRAVGTRGKLQIAVEKRLVTLFQRSFPEAQIGAYDDRLLKGADGSKELRFVQWAADNDQPDFYAPMGTALQYFRKSICDFSKQAFIVPDPARVAQCRKQLKAIGRDPYVGICWRSMMLSLKRGKYYSALDAWGPILKTPGVTFVNLQYGDCAEEMTRAEQLHAVKIHQIEGLDLKRDIDGTAALSVALDLVISAPTAAAATAASVGAEVWFLTAGETWPQLGTEEFPWYRATRVFSPEKFADWQALMPCVGSALAAFENKSRLEIGRSCGRTQTPSILEAGASGVPGEE